MPPNTSFTSKGIFYVITFGLLVIITTVFLRLISFFLAHFRMGIVILGCLDFVSAIVVLYGVYLVFKGKDEFDSAHKKSIETARKFFIYGMVLYVIIGFFLIPWLYPFLLVRSILTSILSIPFLLIGVYLIKELAEDNIKKLLWITFALSIILGPVITLIAQKKPSDDLLTSLVLILPALLFIFCYYKTYLEIKNKEI